MMSYLTADRNTLISSPLLHLHDIITTGPVARGFYVVTEDENPVSRIQEGLVNLLWQYAHCNTNGASVESKTESKPGFHRLSYVRSRRSSQIGQIIWVDSGNVFDPYYISIMARQKGLDPLRVLRAIKVGRPFTAFQFQQMLERVPNAALLAYPDEEGSQNTALPLNSNRQGRLDLLTPNAVWWTPLVIVSDLMKLFYDPELPEEDLMRSFREFLIRLAHLRQRAIVLALLRSREIPPQRRHLLAEVLSMAKRISLRER